MGRLGSSSRDRRREGTALSNSSLVIIFQPRAKAWFASLRLDLPPGCGPLPILRRRSWCRVAMVLAMAFSRGLAPRMKTR